MAIIISLIYTIFGMYIVVLVSTCVQSEINYVEVANDEDLCYNIILVKKLTPDEANWSYLVFILAELLPFFGFFWFNEPHDCFQCVGKDPDRRYSIFQLTRHEV